MTDEAESERPDEAEFETRLSRGEIATYLGQLSAAFDAGGEVRLTIGDEVVAASPPDECQFEVEYEREDDAEELEIDIEWSGGGSAPDAEEAIGDTEEATGDGDEATRDGDESGEADEREDVERSTMGAEGPTSDAADEMAEESGDEPAADTSGETIERDETAASGTTPVSTESQARFELFEDDAGEWRWRLVHRNGNIIATSGEGYTRKAKAEKGMRSVKRNAQGAPARVSE